MPGLRVDEILLQGLEHDRKGDFVPGDFFLAVQARLQALGADAELAAVQTAAVKHINLADGGHVEDTVEFQAAHPTPGLFPGFPGCAFRCALTIFQEARRQGPVVLARLDSALAQ